MLWVFAGALVVVFAVMIRVGMSKKDPKAVIEQGAGDSSQKGGEAAARNLDEASSGLVGADGSNQGLGRSVEKDIKDKARKNFDEANRLELDREKKDDQNRRDDEQRRLGLPTSVGANGRPASGDSRAAGGQVGANGQPVADSIPDFADGWNPETDVIVAKGEGHPAYRYIPAYLRGSNNPSEQADIKKLDAYWLDSLAKPSYGASVQANDAYNQGLGDKAMVRQQVGGSRGVTIPGFRGVNQPSRTALECVQGRLPNARERQVVPSGGVR
jgi:hypothetical protein